MADNPSSQDFDRLIEETRRMSGTMARVGRAYTDREREIRQASREIRDDLRGVHKGWRENKSVLGKTNDVMRSGTDRLERSLSFLSGSADDAVAKITAFGKGIMGLGALTAMFGAAMKLTDTYRQMLDVGQTFQSQMGKGGSMFEMMRQAGFSGTTLAEFARATQRNSVTIAALNEGDGSFGAIHNKLRENIDAFGAYGMTITQLSDIQGDYLDVLRRGRGLQAVTVEGAARDLQAYIETITDLTNTTGKARDQISKDTIAAMNDAAFVARLTVARNQNQTAFMRNSARAIASMAAIPGEAGRVLAQMYAQTVGFGSSIFTEGGRMFVEAGLPEVLGAFDEVKALVEGGIIDEGLAMNEVAKRLMPSMPEYMERLRVLAMADNAAAKQAIDILAQLRVMSEAEIRDLERQRATKARFDNATLRFQNAWNNIVGGVLVRLADVFEPAAQRLMDGFDTFVENGGMATLGQLIESLGTGLGNMVAWLARPETIDGVNGFFANVGSFMSEIAKIFADGGGFTDVLKHMFGKIDWGSFFSAMNPITLLGNITSIIGEGVAALPAWIIKKLENGEYAQLLGAAFLAVLGIGVIKRLLGGLFGGGSPVVAQMTVLAAVVTVIGPVVGGAGIGGVGGGGFGRASRLFTRLRNPMALLMAMGLLSQLDFSTMAEEDIERAIDGAIAKAEEHATDDSEPFRFDGSFLNVPPNGFGGIVDDRAPGLGGASEEREPLVIEVRPQRNPGPQSSLELPLSLSEQMISGRGVPVFSQMSSADLIPQFQRATEIDVVDDSDVQIQEVVSEVRGLREDTQASAARQHAHTRAYQSLGRENVRIAHTAVNSYGT